MAYKLGEPDFKLAAPASMPSREVGKALKAMRVADRNAGLKHVTTRAL